MHLQLKQQGKIHLSHLHHFVSAYVTSKEMVESLAYDLKDAIKRAKQERESVVVDQDCLDHIFVVHPSGNISLYRQVALYEVVQE